jgi:thiamine pyrophosphate-dependent acetolactate synthase large subunit-like protein
VTEANDKNEGLVPERILQLLEVEGIDTLFGIPDPCFVRMFATAVQRNWRVIAPHHEQAGAYMADGLYRLTGKPGVIIGNEGPGVANLAAAAITAAKENIPTFFIAGQRERYFENQIRRGHFQYTHQPRYFEEAMKFIGVIEHVDHVDDIFHEAFRHAFNGTSGPVLIEYPQDYSAATHPFGPLKRPEEYRLVHQRADAESVSAAAELLEKAEQPLLLVGNGVFVSRAQSQVAELAATLRCPVIRSPGALSALPSVWEDTAAYATPAANEAISQADVVLAIGTEIGEPIHYGTGRHWGQGRTDRKWIYVERDAMAIGVNRPIDVPLVGDLRDVVPQIQTEIAQRNLARRMPERFHESRTAHADQLRGDAESLPAGPPIHPAHMAIEISKALPEDPVIIRDGGAVSLWGMAYDDRPSSDIHWCQNFGHLGTGIPHAIGAQLAVGDSRRVVLISGDSAFQFHISEIETAVRKELPIVMIVGCDYAWGLEVKVYSLAFGDASPDVEAHWGRQVRFDKIAEGFGAYGEYVEHRKDIGPAIARALDCGRPAVVQIPIDGRANAVDVPGFREFATWYGEKGYGKG